MGLREFLAGAALIAASGAAAAAEPVQEPDKVYGVAADDTDMEAAKKRARSELPAFYKRLAAPAPDEGEFMVKYDLLPGNDVEYVWVGALDGSASPMTGTLLNQPHQGGRNAGDRVSIPEGEIIDWTYRKGAVMQGGYTNRVVLGRMPADEAAAFRTYLGW